MEIQKAQTEKEQELIDLLMEWSDYPDFINGVCMDLVDDFERQDMIDEINNGNVATPSDAILFALQIDEERGQNDV